MTKNISVVIPTFNRAGYLIKCIDSCLAQTYICEIIVCDHGSTDNTPEVAKKYGDKIKYIRRELDSGVHFCWLDGILHATHDLIHINFDDDWIEPTFIEECLKLFDDSVGCVFAETKIFYENDKTYSKALFNLNKKTGIFPVRDLLNYNIKRLTSPGAGVFRKKILVDTLFVGKIPFSKNEYHGVGPDILFSLMSCNNYLNYGFVSQPLAVFRDHKNSITVNAASDSNKKIKIKNAYKDARIYYFINKFVHTFGIYYFAKFYYIVKKNTIKKSKK